MRFWTAYPLSYKKYPPPLSPQRDSSRKVVPQSLLLPITTPTSILCHFILKRKHHLIFWTSYPLSYKKYPPPLSPQRDSSRKAVPRSLLLPITTPTSILCHFILKSNPFLLSLRRRLTHIWFFSNCDYNFLSTRVR